MIIVRLKSFFDDDTTLNQRKIVINSAIDNIEALRDALRESDQHFMRVDLENKRLREALRPFADMAQYIIAGTPDEAVCPDIEFTAGDLRAARAAMGESDE